MPKTMSTLTPSASKELGRALRFIRQAKGMSLRDVGRYAPMSPQYLQNVERGERLNVSTEVYEKLGHVYGLPPHALDDLVLKAQMMSALDLRGVPPPDRDAMWKIIEHRMGELGFPIRTNLAELVASLLA
jgi:transcriptional regulator with XRE-family HTH domain